MDIPSNRKLLEDRLTSAKVDLLVNGLQASGSRFRLSRERHAGGENHRVEKKRKRQKGRGQTAASLVCTQGYDSSFTARGEESQAIRSLMRVTEFRTGKTRRIHPRTD